MIDVDRGAATMPWQARFAQCRARDVRCALVSQCPLAHHAGDWPGLSPTQVLTMFADSMNGRMIRLGRVLRWQRCRVWANAGRGEVLELLRGAASALFHLRGCIGGRVGQGLSVLEGAKEVDDSFDGDLRAGLA